MGYEPVPPARRLASAAAEGKLTIFAWRFGLATSQVREHAPHSYSCSSWTGSRARIRGDWQNGQSVGPGIRPVFSSPGTLRKLSL